MNHCLELAKFAVELTFEQLPVDIVEKEKNHLLDGIGNGLEGAASDYGKLVIDYVKENTGNAEAVMWGTGLKVSAQQAAFANSAFSNYAELEDAHFRTKFKPNTCLTPAAIACAEKFGASGKEVLTGLIAANEVCLRIGTATGVGTTGYARGWIGTSSIGPIGTAIIAGRMMHLNEEQMAHAISLAGGQPCGIWSGGMSMAKRVLIGRASENGIAAAIMAKNGITGGFDLIDGNWGNIGDIISGNLDRDFVTKDLGSMWMTREIGMKNYPTKGGTHSAIDCILNLQKEGPVPPEEIETILVRATTGIAGNKALRIFPPRDFYEAQNSMAYILAITLFEKQCTMQQFTDEKIHDPKVLELAKKDLVIPDAEADSLAPKTKTTFVDITFKDGRTITNRVDYCKGEPENALTREELNQKFKNAGRNCLAEDRLDAIIGVVADLDTLSDMNPLAVLLTN